MYCCSEEYAALCLPNEGIFLPGKHTSCPHFDIKMLCSNPRSHTQRQNKDF